MILVPTAILLKQCDDNNNKINNKSNSNNENNEIAFIEVNHFTKPKCIVMCYPPPIRIRRCTH